MSKLGPPMGDSLHTPTGNLAVLARLAFACAIAAITAAVFLPEKYVPGFLRSHYLEHFAAFYVLSFIGLAAAPRARVRTLAMGIGLFITALEGAHVMAGANIPALIAHWAADVGGVSAALAPVVLDRYRRGFAPAPPR